MSKNLLDQLKKVSPGFKDDRDEDWLTYLAHDEQIRIRKWRESFLARLEDLDNLRLDEPNSQAEKELVKEIDGFIKKTLLVKLPLMKSKASKLRDEAIKNDFSCLNKRPRLDDGSAHALDQAFESEYLPFDFLPSAMTRKAAPAPKSGSKPKPSSSGENQKSQKEPQPEQKSACTPVDTYLDGVPEKYHHVLLALRSKIERYKCKDRVLEALSNFKRHQQRIEAIQAIRDCLKEHST